MFPDTPAITVGVGVTVWLRQTLGISLAYVTGPFLAMTEAGVFLGVDMLHVESFIPMALVALVSVDSDLPGANE